MIDALSAYQAMIDASEGGSSTGAGRSSEPDPARSSRRILDRMAQPDLYSVDLSASSDVFSAVDSFFNLGDSRRFAGFHQLSPEDKESFVKIVAELAKSGYMGYEELVVDHRIERHEPLDKAVDQRLRGARVYDRKGR